MKISKRSIIIVAVLPLAVILLLLVYLLIARPKTIDKGIVKFSKVFTEHTAPVWASRFSPSGKLLASGSVDSSVIIRDWQSGRVVKTLRHPQGVTNIDFSSDGKLLATSSYDGRVRLWDMETGSVIKTFTGNNRTVWTVAFAPDRNTIAAAGDDKIIFIWDVNSGEVIHRLTGHALNVWIIKFSPTSNWLASGSFDNGIKIWDVQTGKLLKDIAGHTEAVVDLAFSHTGQTLASTSDDKTIKLWNVASGALIKTMEVPEHVQAVSFSPDDKRLMTGGRDLATTGELIQNFSGESALLKGVSARLWDIKTGNILQTFSFHKNDVNDVSFSKDGRWLAMASADHAVSLWRVIK